MSLASEIGGGGVRVVTAPYHWNKLTEAFWVLLMYILLKRDHLAEPKLSENMYVLWKHLGISQEEWDVWVSLLNLLPLQSNLR